MTEQTESEIGVFVARAGIVLKRVAGEKAVKLLDRVGRQRITVGE